MMVAVAEDGMERASRLASPFGRNSSTRMISTPNTSSCEPGRSANTCGAAVMTTAPITEPSRLPRPPTMMIANSSSNSLRSNETGVRWPTRAANMAPPMPTTKPLQPKHEHNGARGGNAHRGGRGLVAADRHEGAAEARAQQPRGRDHHQHRECQKHVELAALGHQPPAEQIRRRHRHAHRAAGERLPPDIDPAHQLAESERHDRQVEAAHAAQGGDARSLAGECRPSDRPARSSATRAGPACVISTPLA